MLRQDDSQRLRGLLRVRIVERNRGKRVYVDFKRTVGLLLREPAVDELRRLAQGGHTDSLTGSVDAAQLGKTAAKHFERTAPVSPFDLQ